MLTPFPDAPEKILLVDDDPSIRQVIEMRLELLGYAVTSCKSPREALEAFNKERFSLVLTDQRMQDMDGTRLMEELHARYPYLPVIIMTAFGKVDDAVDAVRKGAFTYLEKPVKPEELAFHIKAAMRHGRIEERITRERKIWTQVIESIGAGLILVDANGYVSWISRRAQTILGIHETGEGCPYTDLFPSGTIPLSSNALDGPYASGTPQSFEYHHPATDRWILATATSVREDKDQAPGIALLLLDITALKEAQKSLLEQERLKGVIEMAGTASHQLSQPLQVILWKVDTLLGRLRPGMPGYEDMAAISENIETMIELITKLNTITRYARMDYPGTTGIVDLDQASRDCNPDSTPRRDPLSFAFPISWTNRKRRVK